MPTKSSSALATRSLESFAVFNDKRFVAGYQPLVTIQPLNKSKKRGWFIRNSDLDSCGWTAEVAEFDKGSVSFDYEQTFGMPPNTTKGSNPPPLSFDGGRDHRYASDPGFI